MNEINENVNHECLYLQREDKNEIFLDNIQIMKQHQINALRFIFKQFKMNNPAVVMNFPPESGKSVIVALFLKAIHSLLKKPVLILCNNKNDIDAWKDTLLQWTHYTNDDIAIESSNVYIKKKIFIKLMTDIVPYQRRSWSILIIKNDLDKNILKLSFETDFKIWITSFDVKKDLNLLSLTYTWLTKGVVNAKDFLPSEKTRKEEIEKAILLDSFLEDFVIQETRIEPIKMKKIPDTPEIELEEEKPVKKSRKNKDASGTKIKRSKRVFEDDHNEVENENNDEILKENNPEKQIQDENEESQNILQNYNNITDVDINMDNDLTEELSFGDAVEDIVRNENEPSNKSNESLNFDGNPPIITNTNTCDEEITNDKRFKEKSDECITQTCEVGAASVTNIPENDTIEKDSKYDESDRKNVSIKSIEGMHVDEEKKQDILEAAKSDDVLNESKNMEETGTDSKIKTESHKDIDSMISEMEEKALKKFKGSLLDSIFKF